MYSWQDVARRTCLVYDAVCDDLPISLMQRLEKCYRRGPVFGIIISILIALDHLLYCFLKFWYPVEDIEQAVDYPREAKQQSGGGGGRGLKPSLASSGQSTQSKTIGAGGARGGGGCVQTRRKGGHVVSGWLDKAVGNRETCAASGATSRPDPQVVDGGGVEGSGASASTPKRAAGAGGQGQGGSGYKGWRKFLGPQE
jgi:hypothetical protein